MEIEMKYAVPDKKIADEIWDNPKIDSVSDLLSAESVKMKAVYFDTENWDLREKGMALRVRLEGDRRFATLKWGGRAYESGLHQRNEINIPVTDDNYFIQFDPKIFDVCEEGKILSETVGEKALVNILEMRFIRRRKRLTYKNSVMELSLDNGTIITDKGEVPISEMEIELFSGKKEHIKKIGSELAESYKLTPKKTSKFSDGMALIETTD